MRGNTIFCSWRFLSLAFIMLSAGHAALAQPERTKVKTIVTTDGEVDDQDSFIRMLLYSNEFDLVGLIYSSSQWHYKGDEKGTAFTSELEMTAKRYGSQTSLRWPGTTWMEAFIDKYAAVYGNLKTHAGGYPTPAYLRSIIRIGNIDFEGEMNKDTPGSDFIKQILLDADTEPVYIQIWGGTNTVARALKSIEDSYKDKPEWSEVYKRVSAKAILYTVLDQDATYKRYIQPHWKDIRVLYNETQFWNFAYPWPRVVPEPLQQYLRGPWFKEHIKFGHGPLLSDYYLWGDGTMIDGDLEHNQGDTAVMKKFGMGMYDFISEGDSPAYLHLIDVGLENIQDASFGGWGGRMVRSSNNPNRWQDGDNVIDYNPYTKKADGAYPQTRWIDAIQQDFAARADWCVMNADAANHPPVVHLNGAKNISAKAGSTVGLSGIVSDPDGNETTCKWWQYDEVDTFNGKIEIMNPGKLISSVKIPGNARRGDTIHIILEVKDNGIPALTRYRRLIITIT